MITETGDNVKWSKSFLFFVLGIIFSYPVWQVYDAKKITTKHQKTIASLQKPDSLTISDNKENKEKSELKWPNTTAPDTTDPHWEFNNNLNINGVAYYKVETTKGKWQWVEDIAVNESIANEDRHKRNLMEAMQFRVLTDAEMNDVISYGRDLNIYNMEPYQEEQKQRELNEALLQQYRLRHR